VYGLWRLLLSLARFVYLPPPKVKNLASPGRPATDFVSDVHLRQPQRFFTNRSKCYEAASHPGATATKPTLVRLPKGKELLQEVCSADRLAGNLYTHTQPEFYGRLSWCAIERRNVRDEDVAVIRLALSAEPADQLR